jgi:DNA repair protein RadC
MENWDHDSIEHIEEFKLMLLTRSNKVLGIAAISKGGISGTVTDVRIILQYAIKVNASGIIIVTLIQVAMYDQVNLILQ